MRLSSRKETHQGRCASRGKSIIPIYLGRGWRPAEISRASYRGAPGDLIWGGASRREGILAARQARDQGGEGGLGSTCHHDEKVFNVTTTLGNKLFPVISHHAHPGLLAIFYAPWLNASGREASTGGGLGYFTAGLQLCVP